MFTSAHALCGVQKKAESHLKWLDGGQGYYLHSVYPHSLSLSTHTSDVGAGGYEHTFVDKIAAKYYCNICSKVLRDARLTACCSQHYCDSCLEQWSASSAQNKNKTCPHCRKKRFQSFLNEAMILEINELRVKCSNHEKECGWVGELGDLKKHIESENGCGYAMVRCYYSGHNIYGSVKCSHRCQRQSLAEHQNTCKWRRYKCEHCGEVDTYDAIAGGGDIVCEGRIVNHYYVCDQYPLECPNKCGEKTIKRCDIRSHRDECPLEPLPCPFKNVGCSPEIPRHDMDNHCQTNMQTHLLMMAKSHDELLHKNVELFSKKNELLHKNEELFHKNEELTKRVTALERLLTRLGYHF